MLEKFINESVTRLSNFNSQLKVDEISADKNQSGKP